MAPSADPAAITLGLSISLTGGFAHQGRQALRGLQLWAAEVDQAGGLPLPEGRRQVRLVHYDDASRAAAARANAERLLTDDRVHLLFGPYSSGLTMAVARVAATHGRLLWNHGGTSDALFRQGWTHLVSVACAASEYLRALPAVLRRTTPGVRRLAALYDQRGTFATNVIAGLAAEAAAAGLTVNLAPFQSPIGDPAGLLDGIFTDAPDGLAVVGRYQDDVELVQACRTVAVQPLVLVAVAAGLDAFARDLGPLAEGVIGPSQWEPGIQVRPAIGPAAETFVATFRAAFGEAPEYPATQAYALGLVLGRCVEEAGGLDEARLRAVAAALDTTTLFGRFRLDPRTTRQVGHRGVLIRWEAGRKQVLWPTGCRQGE
jgi:branched-chain amino acid transport system substrate-binding protein